MARGADHANFRITIHRFRVGVVTFSAPEPARTAQGAAALRELLHLADCFGFMTLVIEDVGDHRLLQVFARTEITPVLARVQNADIAFQVALFAKAVARPLRQFPWIQDVRSAGLANVLLRRAVAALTGNRVQGGRRRTPAVAIGGTGTSSGMAEQARRGDRPVEIDGRRRGVAG